MEYKNLGKYKKLEDYRNVKRTTGTVDFVNWKTCYIELGNNIIANILFDYRYVNILQRKMKRIVENDNNNLFGKYSIVDVNVPLDFLGINKTSFMSIEITLFVNNKHIEYKSPETLITIENISKKLIDMLSNEKHITFTYDKI